MGKVGKYFMLTFDILFVFVASDVFQAKLRYDPIELDPEDMCRMASEQPQVESCLLIKFEIGSWFKLSNPVYYIS